MRDSIYIYIQLIQSKLNSKLVLKGILANTFYLHAEMKIRRKTGLKNCLPKQLRLQNLLAAGPVLALVRVTAQYTNTEHQQGKDKGFDTQGLRWQVAAAIFILVRSCCRRAQAGPLSWPSRYHSVTHLTELQDRIWKGTEVLKKEINQWVKSHLLSFLKLCSS